MQKVAQQVGEELLLYGESVRLNFDHCFQCAIRDVGLNPGVMTTVSGGKCHL